MRRLDSRAAAAVMDDAHGTHGKQRADQEQLEHVLTCDPERATHGIRLNGLGILQVRKRAARMGRNPATGEFTKIKASKKIAFPTSQGTEGSGVGRCRMT